MEMHVASRLSRRRFLTLTAASAGGVMLGACGGDSVSDTANQEAGTTSGSPSQTGEGGRATAGRGTLSVGMNSTLQGLTPFAIQGYQWSQMVGFLFYDALVTKDEAGDLQPGLATSWDTTDPLKTVLTIREGVTFHDGTPLTARDVAYSIAARSDPALIESTAGRPAMTPEQWVSATAVDELTCEVVTTERVEFLVAPQPILIVPNESFGKVNFANEVLGTGPFKLQQFTTGTSVVAVANPDYWDGAPALETLTIALFADPATASTGLRSGQVDGLYDVAPANLDAVSDVEGTVVSKMGTYANWWIIQMGKEPLDDPEVRLALRHCFNLQALNDAAFKGNADPHTWNPFNLYPDNDGPDAEVTYDPATTKARLEELGKSGISVPILCIEGYQDGIAMAQVLQESFKEAGIETSVEVATASDWLERTYTTGTWEGITFNAGNLPAPEKNFYDYLVNPSSILSAYKEGDVVPDVAELYREINATPFDAPEIDDLLAQAGATVVDDAVAYMGFGAGVSLVLPEGLSGVVTNGYGDVFWSKATFG